MPAPSSRRPSTWTAPSRHRFPVLAQLVVACHPFPRHQHHRHHLFRISLQQLPSSPVSRLLYSRGCVLPCPARRPSALLHRHKTASTMRAPPSFPSAAPPRRWSWALVKPAALAAHDLTASILPSATSNIAQPCKPKFPHRVQSSPMCDSSFFLFFFSSSYFLRFEPPFSVSSVSRNRTSFVAAKLGWVRTTAPTHVADEPCTAYLARFTGPVARGSHEVAFWRRATGRRSRRCRVSFCLGEPGFVVVVGVD